MEIKPDIRYLKDIIAVVYDKDWLKNADLDSELYYMHRGVEKKDGLRYDITIIPSKMLGIEFIKTKGHYHVGKFKEIYIVLEGEAIYLMQKRRVDKDIDDIYAVKARKGDVVIIPSDYGHVTINPSERQELKMANWISDACQSDYLPYEKNNGAGYYFTKNGWIKNTNYKSLPELRFENSLKSIPENLDFLK